MACSPERAQAIHSVDEAWTQLIDRINANWPEATTQLRVLARWKEGGTPPSLGPAAMKQLANFAWLCFSEAAIRATDNRFEDEDEERIPCV